MIRKLSLAALALACATFIAPLALCVTPALAQTIVAPVVAGTTAVALPWGDWAIAAGHELAAIVVPMLGALVMWAIHRYVPIAGMFVTQGLVDKLVANARDYALNAVEGAAKDRVLTVPVGSEVVAAAAQRAVDVGLPWIVRQAGGAEGIAEKVFRLLHLEENASLASVLAPALEQIRATTKATAKAAA